jgi:hypothetical protein
MSVLQGSRRFNHKPHSAAIPIEGALVPCLARAAAAIDTEGLIVEVHPCPEKAMSDGAQSPSPSQSGEMMADLKPYIALEKEARRMAIRAHPGSGCPGSMVEAPRWHAAQA